MLHPRRTAFIAGALYLATVITSIAALALKQPALRDPDSLALSGGTTPLLIALLLELILAAACVGTALVLYPLVRRQGEVAALSFVAARLVEAMLIMTGAVAMYSLATMARWPTSMVGDSAVAPPVDTMSGTLIAIHDAAFLLGPGLIPAANALLLGWLLYRSRLVPRVLPIIGFVGAPLLVLSVLATIFGVIDQVSPVAGLAALPIAAWEISLGVWLVVKGFRPAALEQLAARDKAAASSAKRVNQTTPPLAG